MLNNLLKISDELDKKGHYKISDSLTNISVRIAQEIPELPWFTETRKNPYTGYNEGIAGQLPGGNFISNDSTLDRTPIQLPLLSSDPTTRMRQLDKYTRELNATKNSISEITLNQVSSLLSKLVTPYMNSNIVSPELKSWIETHK
jgi:hypothetical protein